MYPAYQAQADLLWPLRAATRWTLPWQQEASESDHPWFTSRPLMAACRLLDLAQVTHARPDWDIASVELDGQTWPVVEEAVMTTPFATLRRFRKPGAPTQAKVLVVAPMSGHFATLLRDTVRTLLQDHDVHVSDWHNIRDVPLSAGRFGLDEYTQHVMDFLAALGPGAHLLAVCQPCVSALAATALMAEDGHPATPASLTLMAGPIDCRISPTEVNRLATSRPIEWFRRNLISHVPWQHAGAGRRVYPGFVQLGAFMSMNQDRHGNAFKDYYRHIVEGADEKAESTRNFYEEYLAVADLSADFYLETVERVFQTFDLPRGELRFKGRRVNPAAIRRTALLTIEGERDDICSVGQTLAAQDLAPNLKLFMRSHYIQPNVGHYGVFSGRRWQRQVYPLIRHRIQVSQ
ncbi:MAG: polyhydroxyalkanoate depolymerase [Roseateles depolymerans]|uniref:Polyhydroxyalkanoate depolymerase n=1 Tax=Roseateles depolymerans TaxID=76731 RepID=A0A2W5G001_9BURK|nr:MAG: polyhydroxyalkanoate depolymerase [Roseateles depolymerans]